jgi:predicted SAM-dependent methyltransferase
MRLQEWLHAVRLYISIGAEVRGASTHAFVDRCFWRIWRQGADAELFAQFTHRLENNELSRLGLVLEMAAAPQHTAAVAHWRHYTLVESLHMARCQMVRQIPASDVIVDIGGAAPASVQGMLLVMGYRHHFQTLTIVDLPPANRLGQYARGHDEQTDKWIPTEMGRIRYLHRSMTDLGAIQDGSVGLVFCGQSIEHVSVEGGKRVLQEAYRILRRGGILFIDTPNGALTRIQLPNAFIHPEHQVEYRASDLVQMTRAAGFIVQKVGGICPMPRTVRTGVFDEREIIQNARLSVNPEESYLFYIQARKG